MRKKSRKWGKTQVPKEREETVLVREKASTRRDGFAICCTWEQCSVSRSYLSCFLAFVTNREESFAAAAADDDDDCDDDDAQGKLYFDSSSHRWEWMNAVSVCCLMDLDAFRVGNGEVLPSEVLYA